MNPLILTFLMQLGCTPTAQVVVVPDMPVMEKYEDGVLYLSPRAPDNVIVHGLVHDCQYQKGGRAGSDGRYQQRERQARYIESLWHERILDGLHLDDQWK